MAIITISRGTYAGGKDVASQLAKHLDYPVLSREKVLHEIAKDYGIPEKTINKTMNGAPPFWQQVPGKRLAYVKCITAAILAHVKEGNLVYHGVNGQLLLSHLPQVLRVRVIANMEYRIEALMKRETLSKEKAIAHIQRVSKDRSRWTKLLYNVDWQDPGLYDLILNLDKVSTETACTAIASMTEQKVFMPSPENQKVLEDFRLTCRVWATLASNPATNSAGIEVKANDGEVIIDGTADSVKALELIPQIARSVEGVRSVQCDIGVGTGWYW
ncbi:MAG: BON domain-containing protein [Candidatus Electrothrix sp. AR4]|nr:BON domain-containing protein [Candidatus Electrothrix sp. AR4]